MVVQRIAAFSDSERGGNPAGVVIGDELPAAAEMQRVAAEIGYSETVFASPLREAWRVRYFAPKMEVPFCGHATIALGAALALRQGNGTFPLILNNGKITVRGEHKEDRLFAALQSPTTDSEELPSELLAEILELFSFAQRFRFPYPARDRSGRSYACRHSLKQAGSHSGDALRV